MIYYHIGIIEILLSLPRRIRYMAYTVEELKLLYWKLKTAYGFTSDADFMNAWRKDPETWAPVFSIRQTLIDLLIIN